MSRATLSLTWRLKALKRPTLWPSYPILDPEHGLPRSWPCKKYHIHLFTEAQACPMALSGVTEPQETGSDVGDAIINGMMWGLAAGMGIIAYFVTAPQDMDKFTYRTTAKPVIAQRCLAAVSQEQINQPWERKLDWAHCHLQLSFGTRSMHAEHTRTG